MIEEMEGAVRLDISRLSSLLTPVKPEPPPPPAAPLWCTRRRGFVSGFPRSGGASVHPLHCIAEKKSSRKPISRIVNRTSLRASRTLRIHRPAPKQGHDM